MKKREKKSELSKKGKTQRGKREKNIDMVFEQFRLQIIVIFSNLFYSGLIKILGHFLQSVC